MTEKKPPTVLIILDGWGHREAPEDNAIAKAKIPTWQHLWNTYPHTLISTSGLSVGLPEGQMGNSEVGHMSLGAGRVVYQNITRIDKSLEDGDFFTNEAYCQAIDKAIAANKAVHILGLLSPGGIHSHQNHIFAMVKMASKRGAKQIFVHPILDGRDTPPRSAKAYLSELQTVCDNHGAVIASLIGRYYAMDRDNRWDRVEQAYKLYTQSETEYRAGSAQEALQQAYDRGEDDEFVKPSYILNTAAISDGDSVIFMNFRADRTREITRAFVDDNFTEFSRNTRPELSDFVMTTEYAADIHTSCAYPPSKLTKVLGEHLADLGKTQLRIAETEKYAHVTFFFSGGREELFEGEERILVSSPDVATYDLKPEMSAIEVTDKLVEAINNKQYDTIICNFANGDMVGHTGKLDAAIQAVEALDGCLKRITDAILQVDGHCLITADHGNCEQMQDYETNQPHTQHTTELVPLLYVGNNSNIQIENRTGKLADIAPTLLDLMEVEKPEEMTGQSLIIQT